MSSGQARQTAMEADGAAKDVACAVFLVRHSAWIDDELTPAERGAHEQHMESCASCARYARVLAQGVDVLHSVPEVEVTAGFEARLQHRLFHLQDDAVLHEQRSRKPWLAAAAAAALLLIGYQAMAERPQDAGWAMGATFSPSPTVHPHEDVFVNRAQIWEPAVVPIQLTSTRGMLRAGNYTPVVVRAPQYRAVTQDAFLGD